jgi:ATP phosphoribosyltransferase regulatory subunit
MRDLLPAEAASRRALARRALSSFALHGYALVTPPVFEFAEVLERGLGTLDPGDVLRFVEPESGEVAALRPDVTPQVARMIATRLRGMPPPFRLCYEGTVLRRRSGRARKHRQIPQAGVELAGVRGPEGDLELLALAAHTLRAARQPRLTVDLGHAGIVRGLLEGATPEVAASVSEAVARRDEVELEARAAGLQSRGALKALLHLQGGRATIEQGIALLAGTRAEAPARDLLALYDAVAARGIADDLVVDLAEVRGFAYYTGPMFHVFAPGPGEAILSGGRYDELLARFGAPMAAAGFAVDLDRLTWALRTAGVAPEPEKRVVVVGPPDDPRVAALRAQGTPAVAVATKQEAFAWARAWGFSHVLGDALWSAVDMEPA